MKYQILTKFLISRHIFIEVTRINFYVNPSSGSSADTCGQTDGISLRECMYGDLGLHVKWPTFLAYFLSIYFHRSLQHQISETSIHWEPR